MTDQASPAREQPQAVVGPITLGRSRSGNQFTLQPNTVIGPAALAEALGTAIALIDLASTAAGITIGVSCNNGAAERIVITGQGIAGPTISFAAGSLLYAIARTDSDILLLSANGAETPYVSIPIGSETVTVTIMTTHAI